MPRLGNQQRHAGYSHTRNLRRVPGHVSDRLDEQWLSAWLTRTVDDLDVEVDLIPADQQPLPGLHPGNPELDVS